jgi:polygalacturonase
MKDLGAGSNDHRLSRRQWGVLAAAPLVGAALASRAPAAAASPAAATEEKLLGARVYNVRDFGATGDGKTLDTAAVQSAIDACHKDHGGTVLIPAGDFLVGTLELKSNVALHLAAQGRLLGSANPADFRAGNGIPPSNGNIVLLSAADAENVTLEGRGTIDGQGAKFYTGKGDMTGPGQDSSKGYVQRPHLLVFYRCRNLLVRDVFLTNSAYHCCRVVECKHVRLDGVRIHNRVNKNNDGFHFRSSEHVTVSNCDVACQDDACALFGSNRFVTVTNCNFSTRWSIFRFGGGQCRDVAVSNCLIYETYGCPIKMRCGADSRLENISFSNLVMRDVTGPISIGLDSTRRRSSTGPASGPSTNPTTQPRERGVVRNISFNAIRATVVATGGQYQDMAFAQSYRPGETRTCVTLNGAGDDDVLENISLNDLHVTYEGGGTADEASREVPKVAGEYFEIGTPPAYGVYARNVRGLTLHNVRVETRTPDLRPAVVFDHVQDAAVNGLSAAGNPQAKSVLRFVDSKDVLVSAARVLSPASTFLRIEGDSNESIVVEGGLLTKAARPLACAEGAEPKAVTLRGV